MERNKLIMGICILAVSCLLLGFAFGYTEGVGNGFWQCKEENPNIIPKNCYCWNDVELEEKANKLPLLNLSE